MSRESAELDSIATSEARVMRCAFTPWGKSHARELRERARRCGAGFRRSGKNRARFSAHEIGARVV